MHGCDYIADTDRRTFGGPHSAAFAKLRPPFSSEHFP
jgi:hypothetical protein